MFRGLLAILLLIPIQAAIATERWETLPPTPAPVAGETSGYAAVNGIKLFYAKTGAGSPVVLLHGCMAASRIRTIGETRCRRWRGAIP